MVTPYPVVIWASYGIRSSILAREDVPQVGGLAQPRKIVTIVQEIYTFVMAILVIGIIAFAGRVLLLVYRSGHISLTPPAQCPSPRKPLLPSEYSVLEDKEALEDTPLKQQQVIMFA